MGFVLQLLTGILGAAGATTTSSGTIPGPGAAVGLILVLVFYLAVLIPSLALLVRRLHDANFSGWLALLVVVPIVVFVLSLLPSNPAGQRFDQPTA